VRVVFVERRRGAGGKTIVFGILERHGKGYTEIVPNAAKKPLQAAIRGQVALNRIIHPDGWRDYDGLVDRGYKKLFRVNLVSMNLPVVITLSMALNHSGHMPKEGLRIQWCYTKNFSSTT